MKNNLIIFQSSNLIQKWILHDRNWEFFLVILQSSNLVQKLILHDRNWEFFLVRIFLLSDWIRRDTVYLSVFSLKAGKYGPEKTPYLDTFYEVGKTQQHLPWRYKFSVISPCTCKRNTVRSVSLSKNKIFY